MYKTGPRASPNRITHARITSIAKLQLGIPAGLRFNLLSKSVRRMHLPPAHDHAAGAEGTHNLCCALPVLALDLPELHLTVKIEDA